MSGWSDCRIRSYYPESGRPMYVVNKAYGSKVTAIAAYHNCQRFISGSDLGHVVVWEVPEPNYVTDVNHVYRHFLLKEHKAEVTYIQVRRNDSECVTSSIDGSCVIWDLELVAHSFSHSVTDDHHDDDDQWCNLRECLGSWVGATEGVEIGALNGERL